MALNEIHWYGIRGRVALECKTACCVNMHLNTDELKEAISVLEKLLFYISHFRYVAVVVKSCMTL